ncbi:MAG: spore germination protein GerW family protein [Caldilineaceae bacterium]
MDTKTTQNIEPIQEMLQKLGATTVFGEPMSENGIVVIPVAEVTFGFGYGSGYGRSSEESTAATQPAPEANEGGGSGAGAGGRSTPRGFIRITPDEVKYDPITDEARIPLAGILMVAWIVFWVMMTIRAIAKAVAKTQQMKWKVTPKGKEAAKG